MCWKLLLAFAHEHQRCSIAPSSRHPGEALASAPPARSSNQPELPLKAALPKRRPNVLAPEIAARVAVSRRAKPSAVPGYVRLLITLELRRELAEKLSERAIREERNIEAIIIGLIEAAAKRWH